MRLLIPSAPRAVALSQVPGAVRRVVRGAVVAAVLVVALGVGGRVAARALGEASDFHTHAVEVSGTVAEVQLPPLEGRQRASATLRVLYDFGGRAYTASGVEMDAVAAEALGPGAAVSLVVDPARPQAPRQRDAARGRRWLVWLGQAGLALGLLLGLAVLGLEVRRTVRREVEPLRRGALVWVTPAGALPEGRGELRFAAHYYRDDVRHDVTVRGRPGRAPVKQGEKLLAAVTPGAPRWARLIDEDLARTLGWLA